MIQIENTFFALAERSNRDCLVICDRGTMDASACTYSRPNQIIRNLLRTLADN